jgi:hypothetical protein
MLLLAGACATSHHGTRPDDMTAAEHANAAREHSEQITGRHGYGVYNNPYPGSYTNWRAGSGSYPWYYYGSYYSWDPDEEHRALAAAHRDAAEQLKLQYESACSLVPRGLEAMSPLDGFTTSTSPIEHGIVFHLSPQAGAPDVVLARLRCHRAWLRLAPNDVAADSPLLVEGVTWMTHAGANGVEVMATARDDRNRDELARRAALVVERTRKTSAAR